MSKKGNGYGSEWHLCNYIEKHAAVLNSAITIATGAGCIHWLHNDAHEKAKKNPCEWVGMDFLPKVHPVHVAWPDFWPTSGNAQNWDAIGVTSIDGKQTWLLVEAKAHLAELQSTCGAKNPDSVVKINAALDATKAAVAAPASADWLTPYYQHANRLAALRFLHDQCIDARLVLIYFTGDARRFNVVTPGDADGWTSELKRVDQHLGLTGTSPLEESVVKLFLEVQK